MRKSWIWRALVLLSMAGVTWGRSQMAAPQRQSRHWNSSGFNHKRQNNPDLVAPLLCRPIRGYGARWARSAARLRLAAEGESDEIYQHRI